jgi:predicted MPP superfamily phosphohydrolase
MKMKKTDFFITYHHGDEMAARWIAAVLKQAQFSTLSDSWDFLSGETPLEKIEYMFGVARNVMVLISHTFLQSQGDLVKSFCGGPGGGFLEKSPLVAEGIGFLVRIDACDIRQVLGAVEYLDLWDIDEKEAEKRLLEAIGEAKADQKGTVPLPESTVSREEILAKRKQELDQLLGSTIKHNYHMKLDLEQEVEKVVEVKNERSGEMEKRKEWVWETISLDTVLHDGKNYILVNPSGLGKTTFLTYVAGALLDRDAHYPFLPLFFTCIGLNKRADTIEDFILRQVESFYTGTQGTLVSGEWENLCVLIDSLDQARDVDDIVSSLQLLDKPFHYKKAKIILSSRQNTADKVREGFARIRLKLPEADEIQYYLGEENYEKLAGIIEASGELVKAPVLLEMLKTITEKGHVVSTLHNRVGLYTEFTKVLLDQERSKPRFWQDKLSIRHFIDFELEQVLEKIAFFSLAENEIMEIPKEKLAQYCESPAKKEALLNIGILLELFEDREQKIVFRHQSFQAYFASRYIYNQQPGLLRELFGDIAFFYNDVWYEVMRFFVGLEKNTKKTEAIIKAIIKNNNHTNDIKKNIRCVKRKLKKYNLNGALRLIFAVFLMSETRVSIEYVQEVYKQIKKLTNETCYSYFLIFGIDKFNKANDEQRKLIINFFRPMRMAECHLDRLVATKVLGNIGSIEDIHLLKLSLEDEEWSINNAAIEALVKTISGKDIPLLEPLLVDNESDVRSAVIDVFGEIGTEKVIPLLEPLFRDDEKWDVRISAAKALGKIGKPKHIPLLEPLLWYSDIDDRSPAAEAIEKIYKRFAPVLHIDRVLPSKKEEKVLPVKLFSSQALHILHISDIHYALKNDPTITCIFHEFLEDIKKWRSQQNHTNIQTICLTGDIAQAGQKEQYDAINEKINAILETTGCEKENLFIIPGNHDVQEYGYISLQGKTLLEQVRDNRINIDTAVLSSTEHYRLFHDKFANYYNFIEKYGYLSSLPENRHQIPNLPKPWYNIKLKEFPVRIMGLNSALFCLKGFIKYGDIRMGTHQFQEAYFQGKAGDRRDPEVVILLAHHPLNWLAENEYDAYSTLMERYAVLHLHGHIHKTHIEKKQRLFSSSGGYVSIGTGSLYGEKGKDDINTYHIITLDFENQDLHIWARRWNPDTGKWTVYDDDDNNRFPFPHSTVLINRE